jgi:hypothetical protein
MCPTRGSGPVAGSAGYIRNGESALPIAEDRALSVFFARRLLSHTGIMNLWVGDTGKGRRLVPGLAEQVAGRTMARTHRDKDGLLLLADGADPGETAGAKAAAGWGIEGAGNGTLQDDPLPAGIAIHHRHGGHQCLRVGMGRLGKDLIRRPLFDDLAQVHDGHPVADVVHDAQVVGDEQIRQVKLVLEFIQQINHLGLDRHGKGRDRLVADNERGAHGQGAALAQGSPEHDRAGRLTSQERADVTTQVVVSPSHTSLAGVGETVELDITVQDVTDLYAAQVQLAFDPSVVQVRDADPRPSSPGVQIRPGDFLDPRQYVLVNEADNATGEIDFAVTQLYPAEARSGSGVLATVVFEAVGQGTSPVQWVGVRLLDDTPQDPQEIPAGTQDGEIVVEGGPKLYLPLILRDG